MAAKGRSTILKQVEDIHAVLLHPDFLISRPDRKNRIAPVRVSEFDGDRGRREHVKTVRSRPR
jgi:hypothetical protein